MPFDWNDYYTLAKSLSGATEEAKMRSAISRSYYCAFNLARKFILKSNPSYRYTSHKDLWNEFVGIAGMSNVKSYGERIRLSRNKADYDNDIQKLQAEVTMTMLYVQMILNQLK
jgi:uncharacterized protein (UPF0332 family)